MHAGCRGFAGAGVVHESWIMRLGACDELAPHCWSAGRHGLEYHDGAPWPSGARSRPPWMPQLSSFPQCSAPQAARLLMPARLQVHDELVYEVQHDRAADLAALVKLEMERAMLLRVPTPVKLSVGPNWGSLEDVTLDKLRDRPWLQQLACAQA